jgi:hypothetical protein
MALPLTNSPCRCARPCSTLWRRQLDGYPDKTSRTTAEKVKLSINSLSLLLREEGFARLPRRRDDERPPVTQPEPAAIADVRVLDVAPRSFRTRLGGLFVFVPLTLTRLDQVVRQAQLPGSPMIPAEQVVRSLLALKLVGKERTCHVMDLVDDPGIALFAGLNVVPKRSFLAASSSSIDDRSIHKLMAAWFNEVPCASLTRGASLEQSTASLESRQHFLP